MKIAYAVKVRPTTTLFKDQYDVHIFNDPACQDLDRVFQWHQSGRPDYRYSWLRLHGQRRKLVWVEKQPECFGCGQIKPIAGVIKGNPYCSDCNTMARTEIADFNCRQMELGFIFDLEFA